MPSQSGSVYVDASWRTRDRGPVVVIGRIKIGTPGHNWAGTPSNLYVYPKDMGLKQIRSIILQPWRGMDNRLGANSKRMIQMSGSIGSMDTPDTHQFDGTPAGCYVKVTRWQILGSRRDANTGTFSAFIGTIGQTLTANYMAVGE